MDGHTEAFCRNRNHTYLLKAEQILRALTSDLDPERKAKNLDLIKMLTGAHYQLNEYLDKAIYAEKECKALRYQLAAANKQITELKKELTDTQKFISDAK